MDLRNLQKKVSKAKRNLRIYEVGFSKKYGRTLTIQDINDRPDVAESYKKYNQLKKELKEETEATLLQQFSNESTPETDSQQTSVASQSPERLQDKSSVEFVRSPSHAKLDRKLTEDEAFWLGVNTSYSQPTPATYTDPVLPKLTCSQPRLILGSSKPKKSRNLKRSFGRNPFERAISSSQDFFDDNSSVSSVPSPIQPIQSFINDDATMVEDELDEMEGVEIVNHQINPYRKYDPSLFHWEDPSFSIGPGFFSNASPCYLVPILNDPTRRDRVLRKLEKGTLGEVLEENQSMEEELDEDIRQFISTHSRLDPNSFEASVTEIDENLLHSYQYKKKPLQKRQTKLFKSKSNITKIGNYH
ncbi:hypothetical protein MFLAVUS_004928 [Mucor flavus]|uniref:Uncharacterized protein n=1 Tax=Mucor flavus TaxID=439312 RepID=A0ABP9YXA5_9FUNG